MVSFRHFLFATAATIIYVLLVNGASNCPDGEEYKGSGCETCKEGLFRHGDMSVCQAFKTCTSMYQAVLFPGNKTHDVICYCPYEPFTVIMGDQCHAACPAGKYFIASSCQPCPPGKWKNFTGPEECSSCTQCNETIHECNSTIDSICAGSAVMDGGSTVAKCRRFSTGAIAGIVIVSVGIIIVIIVLVVQRKKICPKKQQSGGSTSNREDPGSNIPLTSSSADGASNNHERS